MALKEWNLVMDVLELDLKARRDLFLLLQAGIVGRTHGNKILWNMLSGPALDRTYRDLSNYVTHKVYEARRAFDRPPREHRDLSWWWWTCYERPYARDRKWAPTSVPREAWCLNMGPGEAPLPPPGCWGPAR